MKLNTKIILLVVGSLVLTSLIFGFLSIWQLQKGGQVAVSQMNKLNTDSLERITGNTEKYKNELIDRKKEYIKAQVQTAMSVLDGVHKGVHDKKGSLSSEEKKIHAAGLIKNLRYGPENKDYFWINDMGPKMVMHPYKPELDGKNLSDSKDPNGKRLFVEMVKACREKGEGFVDYHWPKYGADKPQPKISYVKLFKEWGWIIGTGLYIDDIDVIVDARKKTLSDQIKETGIQLKEQIGLAEIEIEKNVEHSFVIGIACSLIILIAFLIFAFFFTRKSITKPIHRIIKGLNEGADQVTSASTQIAASSQDLSDGSSNQAASIEETSSSLEEMSAMTKQNADNANQADSLMKNANNVVCEADSTMTELIASMEKISKASEETSKIIKTIDEIAFQTNLLALNAAVEAARAGEAGAGFAVVADEVRNLAMRAADAAKNTANLIDGTVKTINEGSDIASKTNHAFKQVAENSTKVGELVSEIAAASNEQASGIDQVNNAIAEMDKVVQLNAANAEESAAASETMSNQAEHMKNTVDKLVALVGGNEKTGKKIPKKQSSRIVTDHPSPEKKRAVIQQPRSVAGKTGEIKADQIIPFDDEEFKDF
ncbi:cache domain-containing protein [Thermodesulfobacteriota bacterium]